MEWITNHKLDKIGKTVDFYKSPSLFGSPALALALRSQAELVENKMAFDTQLENSNRIVWAQIDSNVVGGLCYKFKEFGCGFIVLSFTDPAYRGLGINLLCKQHFENDCIANHMTHVRTTVHVNNHVAFNNNKKMGLNPVFTTLIKQLKRN
jgi:predicted GNAT family acetyltransferase